MGEGANDAVFIRGKKRRRVDFAGGNEFGRETH